MIILSIETKYIFSIVLSNKFFIQKFLELINRGEVIMKRNKKNSVIDICRDYCTGCGLCGAVNNKQFSEDEKHFLYPNLDTSDYNLCQTVCPAAGNAVNNYSNGTIWGNVIASYLGWANEEKIRFEASSGGVLTAVCAYLLEKRIVDGVIQVKKDELDPRKTITVISRTKEETISCIGSRYTTSSPLLNIKSMVEEGKKYAFVGKPCDVSALRMYQLNNSNDWSNQIKYMFSFFCAGQPSLNANNKLLSSLGCNSISECDDISYRGYGWPGRARVFFKDGHSCDMEYEKSWMTILGRDVRKCCRFCADGTGEMADISCGDAWYLNSNGKPDFDERPGRNVIFSRTEEGDILLKTLIEKNVISVEKFDVEKDELKKIQPYHYNRKASLNSLKVAMKLCGRTFPLYGKDKLSSFASGFPFKSKFYRFVGTIKRVWRKSI